MREAIEMYRDGHFNKDNNVKIPRTWGPVLRRLKESQSAQTKSVYMGLPPHYIRR